MDKTPVIIRLSGMPQFDRFVKVKHFGALGYALVAMTALSSLGAFGQTSQSPRNAGDGDLAQSRPLSATSQAAVDSPYELQTYFIRLASQLAADAKAREPAAIFIKNQESLRQSLLRTYLVPPPPAQRALGISCGFTEVNGVRIERRVVVARPGVYVTCNVYFPNGVGGKVPGLLVLPGHGEVLSAPSVQSLGLAFAKAGYVAYIAEPFGQGQRGFEPMRNEYLSGMAMGMLIAAGQSQLGLIVDERQRVLDDMQSRGEIDPDRLGVTGASMGGTHSLWMAAVDPRIKAVVSVAAANAWLAPYVYRHHNYVDVMVDQFDFGDEQSIDALIAPRALLRISPSTERPASSEASERWSRGKMSFEELVTKHAMPEGEIVDNIYPFTHDVYEGLGCAANFSCRVVTGPHAYNQAMRELAVAWFDRFLKGQSVHAAAEPALSPLPYGTEAERQEAIARLEIWPTGERPKDFLNPGQYADAVIRERIAQLPAAPSSPANWSASRPKLLASVLRCVRTDFSQFQKEFSENVVSDYPGFRAIRLVVRPEPSISVHVVILNPLPEDRNSKGKPRRCMILLAPGGTVLSGLTDRAHLLLGAGYSVALVDLRGTGETRPAFESGGYLGFRDWDTCKTALKVGQTLAGYWARDLNAAIAAIQRSAAGSFQRVDVWAEGETGFAAVLCAATNPAVRGVVLEGFLSSYASPDGYGGVYVYRDALNAVPATQETASYGSAIPWIPSVLDRADIPQLLALCAPKDVLLLSPRTASGKPAVSDDLYHWTESAFKAAEGGRFQVSHSGSDEEVLNSSRRQ